MVENDMIDEELGIDLTDADRVDTSAPIDYTAHEYERVEEDAPDRCQGITSHGQCNIRALPGTQYCPMHGGRVSQLAQNKQELKNLKINKYRARLMELGSSDAILSLRDEIAVIRMTLESVVNQCETTAAIVAYAPTIQTLAVQTGKLVEQCAKVEEKTGNLLSIDQLMQFSSEVLDLIIKEVPAEAAQNRIADRMVEIMEDVKTGQ